MTASVSIQGVSQRFGTATALDAVSLEIAAGEFVVLLGPSGCGKTTLLTILGGFAEPVAGRVLIGGRDMAGVGPKDRPTTTVFQDYALFPHMTLAENVGFGLRMRGVAKAARRDKAAEMLALVGLAGREDRRPHELSGGQRQRVALARALAVEPDVLLLDEPLGALDLKLRRAMQDELKAIQRRVGTTFVHVTHDQEEAMAIADRIVVMNGGRIEDVGPARDIYLRPKTLFTAGFMGEINKIPLRGTMSALGDLAVENSGDKVLCIRPEALGTVGALKLGPATVLDAAFFGTYVRAHVAPLAAPEMVLTLHLPQGAAPEVGTVLDLAASAYVLLEA
ncbi:MAG: spermidine/putrescine ABC transporter ATP-binding protein [Rhodobacterales bacterium RIFCSPHIGHO2_02_FULL_62_130]|nr:MAG: spermidine/putrescine ABC transporter ATP-binding protein [Rhodobacterales bacterium RIFCSPHIGHO2_02_FULL_62_130]OHC55928.1 MAG: spermidine/putrescine ABC transporter ATP-binding protein [Rhodobacterales bacterium RIFCSPHIGHO2_12_FULL_62_75]